LSDEYITNIFSLNSGVAQRSHALTDNFSKYAGLDDLCKQPAFNASTKSASFFLKLDAHFIQQNEADDLTGLNKDLQCLHFIGFNIPLPNNLCLLEQLVEQYFAFIFELISILQYTQLLLVSTR